MSATVEGKKEQMNVEDLDRVLVMFKLRRLDAIRGQLVARIEQAEAATPEQKAEKEADLKKLQETDSKGDDIIQKAIDEKIEKIKQELTIFDDKENLENIRNIVNVLDIKIQHLKFFGC